VPDYRLSHEADADLGSIADYTLAVFGKRQVVKYLSGLHGTLQNLADFPGLGLPVGEKHLALYRFTYEKHVVFYSIAADHIFIARVLHGQIDFEALL
jgi:toxin ParE1/3/4